MVFRTSTLHTIVMVEEHNLIGIQIHNCNYVWFMFGVSNKSWRIVFVGDHFEYFIGKLTHDNAKCIQVRRINCSGSMVGVDLHV